MAPDFATIQDMQLLVDFFPIVLFFAVYSIYDSIYLATGALMAAMTIQIAVQWFRHRHLNKMLLISGGVVLLFGTATLVLQDAIFIQWKPTIANWLFAVAFVASRYIGGKTLVERMLGESIPAPKSVWNQLNWIWVANFVLLGAANLYVVYNFSEAFWVKFKLASIIGFTLVTMLVTAIWVWKHLPDQPQEES
jgi:intracellular septation protein